MEMLRLEQRSKRVGEPLKENYVRIEIDLTTARDNEALHIAGDYLAVADFDGSPSTTYFKLNHKHSRKIYPNEVEKIQATFGGIYLTNAAEAGKKLVLYVGRAVYIFPSSVGKTKLLESDGTLMTPVQDKRFISHTGGHLKVTLATAATAQVVSATSIKVRWAIIGVEDYNIRWAFGTPVTATKVGQRVTKANYITLENCDLSEIKFVNETAGAGELPVLNIEYITEA